MCVCESALRHNHGTKYFRFNADLRSDAARFGSLSRLGQRLGKDKKQNRQMNSVPGPEDGIGRPISPTGRRGLALIPGQLDFIASDRRHLPMAWLYSSPA